VGIAAGLSRHAAGLLTARAYTQLTTSLLGEFLGFDRRKTVVANCDPGELVAFNERLVPTVT
jgi:hypothetical protein